MEIVILKQMEILKMMMNKLKKAIDELSISIACLLDEPTEIAQEDLKHIQNQMTIIENIEVNND